MLIPNLLNGHIINYDLVFWDSVTDPRKYIDTVPWQVHHKQQQLQKEVLVLQSLNSPLSSILLLPGPPTSFNKLLPFLLPFYDIWVYIRNTLGQDLPFPSLSSKELAGHYVGPHLKSSVALKIQKWFSKFSKKLEDPQKCMKLPVAQINYWRSFS